MSEKTQELKPCPFCGGEGKLEKTCTYGVQCQKCYSCVVGYNYKKYAVKAWNNRTTDHLLKEMAYLLKEILDSEDHGAELLQTHRDKAESILVRYKEVVG